MSRLASIDMERPSMNPIWKNWPNYQKKTVFLLGDYNVDLSKYEKQSPTNEFFNALDSSMFLPYIIQPTRLTSNSKTIIDNIFSNIISTNIIR